MQATQKLFDIAKDKRKALKKEKGIFFLFFYFNFL